MPVTFHKMHGLGNDFVLLDLRQQKFDINGTIAKKLSNRHTGVGCDQVLVLRDAHNTQHLAAFEVWNADGSRAEQCGNGVRCLGYYLHLNGEAPDDLFELSGPAGVIKIRCMADAMVQVDMGQPKFEPAHVPISLDPVDDWYPLEIDKQHYRLGAASMGNPHCLMLVDDLATTDVARLGAALSSNAAFPEGCNVGFVELQNRQNIRLRVFERGAAETYACGSGACSAMSILRRAGLVDKTVNVTQKGGDLTIAWTGGEDSVIMTGPAAYVFKGIFE